jgi:diguanylate cyclase (GGDEF)-like protein/PAS domain S-box-containing protein
MTNAYNILVVDDDAVMRLMASQALIGSGFNVAEATGGKQALQLVKQKKPDLILLDVTMPEFDGFSVCRELRKSDESRNIPVIMLTALDDVKSIGTAYEAGATDFIIKPINWHILVQRVNYVLRASEAFSALRTSQSRLEHAQRIAHLGHWEWDIERDLIQGSDEAYRIFGIEPGTALNSPTVTKAIPIEDIARIKYGMRELIKHGVPFALEHRVQHSNGEFRVVQQQAEVFSFAANRAQQIIGTVRDITVEKQTEEHIRRLAFYDSLTGLPNRRMFQERLTNALAVAERNKDQIAVLFLDLDRFKRINDTLGHSIGDAFLAEMAARLKNLIRRSDTVAAHRVDHEEDLVARLGGDEFTVLLTDFKQTVDIAKVAQRILIEFQKPVTVNGRDVSSGVSIGIALYPEDGADVDTILKNADTAMFHAKSSGRGRYQYYSAEMNASAMAKLALENDLRHAIANRDFVLHYQPKLDMATDRIVSVEALVRWQHPQRGLILPGEFIGLAEETGMIMELGAMVIEEACLQFNRWQTQGVYLESVAVNLSPVQFRRTDLVEHIAEILDSTGVPHHCLELEITEGVVMHNEEKSIETMQRLKLLEIGLSMDDFGVGYSSLSHLTRFPIDRLKIDRSFISDLPQNHEKAAVVRAIIAMAHSLNLTTVAEGVETLEQERFMRSAGCNQFQGYFLSRPIPAEELALLVRRFNHAKEVNKPSPENRVLHE